MPPVFGVWFPTERTLLRRVHDRLARTGGCTNVRYEPSRIDANDVLAEVDPAVFLERSYSGEAATLRVEFDLTGERPRYWIQWWEPGTGRSLGWHRDETEPEYGPVHVQRTEEDGSVTRRSAPHVEGEHPYRSFERVFVLIPETIADLGWE